MSSVMVRRLWYGCTPVTGSAVRMASVKAAVLAGSNAELHLSELTKPKLKKDQVRIKVHCCGLNIADMLVIKEKRVVTPKTPFVPGYEMSGELIEVGSKAALEGFSVGNRVVALNKLDFGGLAEECTVKASNVWQLPASVSYKDGVALADSYATSLIGLSRRARVKENDTLLIAAGTGGLGLAAIDIAANVFKAKVIAVSMTEQKADLLRDRGAWAALTYHPQSVINTVEEVTKGKGVQIAFDGVGGDFFETVLKCLAHEGTVVVAGYAIRTVPPLHLCELLPPAAGLVVVSLRNYLQQQPLMYRQAIQDTLDMCDQQLVSPYISKEFALDQVNDAFNLLEQGSQTGKLIVNLVSP